MPKTAFKICALCLKKWKTVTDFLEDPTIALLGYQADFVNLETGLFLFNHETCTTTLALSIHDFNHLRIGPIFTENKVGKDECPGYCLHQGELSPCINTCECRWVRDVIQIIKDWKKAG